VIVLLCWVAKMDLQISLRIESNAEFHDRTRILKGSFLLFVDHTGRIYISRGAMPVKLTLKAFLVKVSF